MVSIQGTFTDAHIQYSKLSEQHLTNQDMRQLINMRAMSNFPTVE